MVLRFVGSRVGPLIKYTAGKTVLDIGCIGMGTEDTYGGRNWIFGKIAKVAKKLVGIDIQKEEIEKMKKRGYDVRCHSADKPFSLNEKFDIVVSEEVIEHLYDLRTFLDNIKRHLKDDGTLILTSPNPQAFEFFVQKLLFGKTLVNVYHTHWQNEITMKYLLGSSGFELKELFFLEEWAENTRGKIFQVLFFWLPKHFGRNTVYIAKKKL